ncbi:MAG: PilZ domain-containing protein [Gemmataceae bacterium]|nr:PilZ domain-containing protein [Gemmataceae bacterium]
MPDRSRHAFGRGQSQVLFRRVLSLLGLRDTRATTRYSCQLPAFCRPVALPRGTSHTAVVHNISLSGCGLLVMGPPMEPDRVLTVMLQFPIPGWRTPLLRVIHLRPAGPYSWFLGGRWMRPLEQRQLETVLTTPDPGW